MRLLDGCGSVSMSESRSNSRRSNGLLNIVLVRLEMSPQVTMGLLAIPGLRPFTTLEPPWKQNLSKVSCIPAGTYICQRRTSLRFGETFEVCGVPGRKYILFHWGNTVEDTEGCIIIGSTLDWDLRTVSKSKDAFTEFLDRLKSTQRFYLSIEDVECQSLPETRDESDKRTP